MDKETKDSQQDPNANAKSDPATDATTGKAPTPVIAKMPKIKEPEFYLVERLDKSLEIVPIESVGAADTYLSMRKATKEEIAKARKG